MKNRHSICSICKLGLTGSGYFPGYDIIKTIFDALQDRLHAISEKMLVHIYIDQFCGPPPPKTV